jgi:hypothetical protein
MNETHMAKKIKVRSSLLPPSLGTWRGIKNKLWGCFTWLEDDCCLKCSFTCVMGREKEKARREKRERR